MANALQDFMRGVASGNFDITSPFFRAQAAAQAKNAQVLQQQQLAERMRQFNSMLPIRQTTANAGALTAQTGANKYASRNEDLASKTRANIATGIAKTYGNFGDVEGQSQVLQQAGTPQNLHPMDLAAQERAARGKKISQVGNEAEARRLQQQKGAKYKAGLKVDTQGAIKERQALNNIARAYHAITIQETQLSDPFKSGNATQARAAAQDELQNAVQTYQQITGKPPPTAAEIRAVLQQMAPAQSSTVSPEDAQFIEQMK